MRSERRAFGPLLARMVEIGYLIKRVEDQPARIADVLPKESLDEYRESLRVYREIAKMAR